MKTQIWMTLAFLVQLSAFSAEAETLFLRAPGVKMSEYQEKLRESLSRRTPMEVLERRLQNTELPLSLQKRLDEVLFESARQPERSLRLYEDYYNELAREPRSAGIRETMLAILEKMMTLTSEDARKRISLERDHLENVGREDSRLSLTQREVIRTMEQLRQRPGGEDVVLFWNGVRWAPSAPVEATQKSQWTFVSSQWRARSLEGTWSEVAPRLNEGFLDWVHGNCEKPEFPDLTFVPVSSKEALFPKECVQTASTSIRLEPLEAKPRVWSSEKAKPLLWGAAAIGLGLFLLQASGKKIQFQK